jgi:hypothetical protein
MDDDVKEEKKAAGNHIGLSDVMMSAYLSA